MNRSLSIVPGAWAGWAVALALSGSASGDDRISMKIEGNGKILGETPVIAETSRELPAGSYILRRNEDRPGPTAQVFRDRGITNVAVILDPTTSLDTYHWELDDSKLEASSTRGVELVPHGRRIEIRIDGKLVTEYFAYDGPKPYFFPLIGPSGAAMTRAYPMKLVEGEKIDHPHHRSLWFTHGSVNKVDFWSEMPGHGRIVETSRPTLVGGPVVGVIRTTDDWLAPDGRQVCEDERVLRIYATRKARVLDFEMTLKATSGPVTFGDTKEGMFGLRVASSMDVTAKGGGKILNAEGLLDKAAWGQPSSWVDYSGPVEGRAVGVAIFNHPTSFRYPTTWHVRDYGLFAANPFGWRDFGRKQSGEFVLADGQSILFRYRVVLHEGDATSADLPALFRAYEAPPRAVIE